MELSAGEQRAVLCKHVWETGLHYSDFLQRIQFGADWQGTMVQGDGQATKIEAEFRYSILAPGHILLEFFDPLWRYYPEELASEWPEELGERFVWFELLSGPREADYFTYTRLMKHSYPWLLRFRSEPFPPGREPSMALLDYYGIPPGPAGQV